MGPICCTETSVRNYHYSLRYSPEERSSHPLCSGSLKSRKLIVFVSYGTLFFTEFLVCCVVKPTDKYTPVILKATKVVSVYFWGRRVSGDGVVNIECGVSPRK